MLPPFTNEPIVLFTEPEQKLAMEQALQQVEREFGREYPLVVGGEHLLTADKFNSINPSRTSEVVGVFSKGDAETARKALAAATKAFDKWRWTPPEERARYLLKAAAVMRRRRYELAAWMVVEEGKNWIEAYADVAEAIDFCEFYAREMMRLGEPQPLTPYPGEENNLYYIPLGVGVVIPPWNFPCAILVGMTTAALVAGNTVVLKPASASPAIAYKFFEILEEIDLPPGVVNFLPGSGGVIGDLLVSHPKTRFIAFTGSQEVGLRINRLAAKAKKSQLWIKRVIAEMGGKDFIIVDGSADLDAAAHGIMTSAFGFQGQKCSACSRAIVTDDVYDTVLEKVVALTKEKVTVGDPRDFSNFMGPVIDAAAETKILEYIEIGKKEGRLVLGGDKRSAEGYFINPTIVADVAPTARLAQEEIFGPVLAFIRARDFNDAVKISNNTVFGLTGAVYSSNRAHLERARRECHVGNLYFNRKCTAALVGVHPFGGFNMSGTDSKAGGRDYLLLFTQAKVVSEAL
ncbi:MAG: L-glutamate gamma-semialdehyde dehydrogenase [Candidatus Coatesbacteria bacterium]|nr:MAG: L-glutamate gamma-semialdehyde dehydrogenase [Candidatus Coatesbacteria bacterium]